MSTPIEHTILIRADASHIFRALIERDEVAAWWGQVGAPGADSPDVWAGLDREEPVTIALRDEPRLLVLTLRQQHPREEAIWVDARIAVDIESGENACLVHVTHEGIPAREWRSLISDGWVEALCLLQAWVESGRSARLLDDPARFTAIQREITISTSVEAAWEAITEAEPMETWLSGGEQVEVVSASTIGRLVDIRWSGGAHVGGEVVLSTAPTDLVVHWWDQDSLDRRDDPGMITVQRWHLEPQASGGTTIRLTETGYDLTTVDADYLQSIEDGWDMFLGSLKDLLIPGMTDGAHA